MKLIEKAARDLQKGDKVDLQATKFPFDYYSHSILDYGEIGQITTILDLQNDPHLLAIDFYNHTPIYVSPEQIFVVVETNNLLRFMDNCNLDPSNLYQNNDL